MSFQVDIKSDSAWNEEILQTPGLLQVVELYQEWSGPCKAVQSTFKRIYFEMSDSPLKFYTACVNKVSSLAQYEGSCEPLFLFYKDGQELQRVQGVKVPDLSRAIMQLLQETA
uniref:Flagellar outer arm dynein 14 kDa light chain lc5 n=1 Tax=Tetraselmis sp. GSL018 TaxID=582737 RepID=A0A061SHR5_9CHLO|mmetsp:Transcript_5392/g.13120  ORF Transcript_5392/g.13120 Transcript_5392/m.13120 type:complete len:113 (+) Transcript_5392:134-472(+)|eukprot:CAMPEP_0177588226 /NCGR_PEP_ID=MMETSP0419_2-20121207/6110_1 /TAXON_ID=582737 /ORGANISM="Tetraselmis sp., Strain GSL018" /LENGTH=112 /DNA_ID=CAMNT_0019078405 /DNA_START=72 /DNA_END=410 /DNA_ORIENTATION=-